MIGNVFEVMNFHQFISQTRMVHLWWLILWSLKPQPGISQTNTSGTFVTSISLEDPKPQRAISQTYPVDL
jgi:hypothetical protein